LIYSRTLLHLEFERAILHSVQDYGFKLVSPYIRLRSGSGLRLEKET
jgi:hypothetical protein